MIGLSQSLQQKLQQRLSPLQIQAIRMLELSTLELEQNIKKELEENPMLEEGNDNADAEPEAKEEREDPKEATIEDFVRQENDTPSYKLTVNNYSKDDKKTALPFAAGESFQDYLFSQFHLLNTTPLQENLGEYLIGCLDNDGYLRRPLSSIVDDIAFGTGMDVQESELEATLKMIQGLDPAGVGARDLQECLLLQLERLSQTESVRLAIKIVRSHFVHFTKKQYPRIMQSLKLDDAKMKLAVDEIIRLNPKPGNMDEDASGSPLQITPDFLLEYNEGQLNLVLNSRNAPELKLSRSYLEMMREYASASRTKEAAGFLKQKMDAAKGFIEAVKQRQTTMLKTMTAIMEYQKAYFEDGDETKLRPMILKDIADMTGYDISTISRVVNNKYIQTHFGIISLKSFFSEGMRTESGEEVSNREIKNILTHCIEQEDKKNPVTDEQLMDILNKKGYQIARRTVAKYRETLGIPIARLRKSL